MAAHGKFHFELAFFRGGGSEGGGGIGIGGFAADEGGGLAGSEGTTRGERGFAVIGGVGGIFRLHGEVPFIVAGGGGGFREIDGSGERVGILSAGRLGGGGWRLLRLFSGFGVRWEGVSGEA